MGRDQTPPDPASHSRCSICIADACRCRASFVRGVCRRVKCICSSDNRQGLTCWESDAGCELTQPLWPD